MHAKMQVQTRDPCNLSGPSKAVRKKVGTFGRKFAPPYRIQFTLRAFGGTLKQFTHRVPVSPGNPYRLTTRETCFRNVQKTVQFLDSRL